MRAARTRINSSSTAVSWFGILETAVVAIAAGVAVVAVVDDVARVSPDDSNTIGASAVNTS